MCVALVVSLFVFALVSLVFFVQGLVFGLSFSSIVCCMCGHVLFHMLASDMCRW